MAFRNEAVSDDLLNYQRLEPTAPIRRHVDRVGIRIYARQEQAKVA